LIWFESRAKH